MVHMGMGMDLLPQQQMKASPALIALNNMLVLSTTELQELVQRELEENPALDQAENSSDGLCETCGRPLTEGICLACLHDGIRLSDGDSGQRLSNPDDEFDPLLAVAAPISLQETLQRDLHIALPPSEHLIADFLIGSLDEQGFLDCSVEEAADILQVEVARVEAVLEKLQELGPPGVGARNIQECLLIQLERLERTGVTHPLIRRIVTSYWIDFGEHRYSEIARSLGVSYDDIVGVRDFMRQHLRPFPLKKADEDGGSANVSFLIPDVVISDDGHKLVVEVVESKRYSLRLNPLYQELMQQVAQGQQEVSNSDSEHLSTFVSRARLFLTNMRQRRETIRRIGEYLLVRQEAFLRNGIRHLAPLTRAEVADAIGVHESTVSRATANKYVQLPNREIIPFSHFFSASLSVKDVIQELIAGESTPLTDEQIVDILRDKGFQLARRTVAKYRGQLGILPSNVR
ncbi:MAG: RNA polymerase factor sigma-54 [Chloroflexaceae bacterium]|nr:RNA polymerase factor sigma-54 [Chloroflexaceae bacterium]